MTREELQRIAERLAEQARAEGVEQVIVSLGSGGAMTSFEWHVEWRGALLLLAVLLLRVGAVLSAAVDKAAKPPKPANDSTRGDA